MDKKSGDMLKQGLCRVMRGALLVFCFFFFDKRTEREEKDGGRDHPQTCTAGDLNDES